MIIMSKNKSGNMMENLKLYKDVYTRKELQVDRKMVNECLDNYSVFSLDENSIVMDLGMNIGAFGHMCKNAGVKNYIGVEPDDSNFNIASMNVDGIENLILYKGVATISKDEELTFYQSDSKNSKCAGTVVSTGNIARRKNGEKYSVKNYNVYDLIDKHRPTHLKVDIEGAEVEWLKDCDGKFHECIQELSFEVHAKRGIETYIEFYDKIAEDFDHVSITPNTGFPGSGIIKYEKLGIDVDARIWGVDIFLKRKS